MWDPDRYLTYADQRGRPFAELVARVGAENPSEVVDQGCGPGNLTRALLEKWPGAHVTGMDSSAEMIDAASAIPGIDWVQADLQVWQPSRPVDVLISNATLQWVPDHLAELPRLAGFLAPGGWFAFQVPGNFGAPSHVLLREVINQARWRDRIGHLIRPGSHEPVEYLDALAHAGLVAIDVWESTYLHVLTGENPVLNWVSGTALRPILAALDGVDRDAFLETYREALGAAYPTRDDGTVLFPFRRIFAVAQRPTASRP